jgi:hypothetical protein
VSDTLYEAGKVAALHLVVKIRGICYIRSPSTRNEKAHILFIADNDCHQAMNGHRSNQVDLRQLLPALNG